MKKLRLRLERTAFKPKYTIGHLYYVDGNGEKAFICDTIEDKNRDLNHNGKFDNGEKKVKSQTCIPFGTYKIGWSYSPKFGVTKYKEAKPYGHIMPWIQDVPSFSGILIHCGTNQDSSAGCVIVGFNKVVGKVIDSRKAFDLLMSSYLIPAKKAGKQIFIEIV